MIPAGADILIERVANGFVVATTDLSLRAQQRMVFDSLERLVDWLIQHHAPSLTARLDQAEGVLGATEQWNRPIETPEQFVNRRFEEQEVQRAVDPPGPKTLQDPFGLHGPSRGTERHSTEHTNEDLLRVQIGRVPFNGRF